MSEGFILSSSIRNAGRNSTQVVFQGRMSDGRRFRWTVSRPRLLRFYGTDFKTVTQDSRQLNIF
ncbi:MAG: hypothetical protein M3Y08_13745 [Fibrobacterota bacterium]|nr:hypothetical protein [Fibrobacterota bacterium]